MQPRPRERRNGAEHQSGDDRQPGPEREHHAVDADLVEPGNCARSQRRGAAQDQRGRREAQRAAADAQRNALGQKLPHDPAASRAERTPDGQLPPPCDPVGKKQTGHVDAGDGQHEGGNGAQQDQRRPVGADHLFLEGYHVCLE